MIARPALLRTVARRAKSRRPDRPAAAEALNPCPCCDLINCPRDRWSVEDDAADAAALRAAVAICEDHLAARLLSTSAIPWRIR